MSQTAIFVTLICLFTIRLSDSLFVYDREIQSPRIDVSTFERAYNLTLRLASNHGCKESDYENPQTSDIWIADTGFCSIPNQIRKAYNSGVKQLLLIWTEDGHPGLNVRLGAIGVKKLDIQAFEVTKSDGKNEI
jgi:hypothetical protein